jgi:hypothetical protein
MIIKRDAANMTLRNEVPIDFKLIEQVAKSNNDEWR